VSIPSSSKPPSTSACTIEITMPSGMKRRPIPKKRRGRERYIRAAPESTWPQRRRCARRRGAAGRHFVRLASHPTSASRIAIVSRVVVGSRRRAVKAADPFSTPEQKKSVACVPKMPPVGTA
jgi:hypothetical protein